MGPGVKVVVGLGVKVAMGPGVKVVVGPRVKVAVGPGVWCGAVWLECIYVLLLQRLTCVVAHLSLAGWLPVFVCWERYSV